MNLKDKIFDLLQRTYGLDVDAIAERLNVSAAEVFQAADEMLAAGLLWETSLGEYRCVLPPPAWVDSVKESVGCEGMPGLSYRYVPEDSHLELFPIPFIREGDEDSGICFMIHWHAELNALLELFDARPNVTFGATVHGGASFSIEGTIGGVDAWVEIRDRPPESIPPALLMTADGGFRELTDEEREEYEIIYTDEIDEEDEDDDDDDDDDDEQPRPHGLWTPSDN